MDYFCFFFQANLTNYSGPDLFIFMDTGSPSKNPRTYRIAIAGFRHGHILSLLKHAAAHPQITVAATCEEKYESSLMPANSLKPDFTSFDAMLSEVDCDIIGLGDVYAKRGGQAIRALRAGKHVIADKPITTTKVQLDTIASLASENQLSVGLMLDLRENGNFLALRELIHSGRLGEVQTVTITGQHPLKFGIRPGWYFEEGMHGGTFNDIGIHAMDLIPWLTGLDFAGITAARSWNAKADFAPHFKDCAQCMIELSNGGSVLGDFSYLAPDRCGFQLDGYWRTTVHGTGGFAETSSARQGVLVADNTNQSPELIVPATPRTGGYLGDFLAGIQGTPARDGLTTESCLKANRMALALENAAN